MPHVRIIPAAVFFLLALSPCPRVTPSIKPAHVRSGWRVCTCPRATADLSERDSVCRSLFGKGESHLPRSNSCSTLHVGTEVLWGSALTDAVCGTLFSCLWPIPCSAELLCCLTGVFLMSNVEPRDLVNTASCPFPVCPWRMAVADAFQCFSAVTGVSKREN